MSTPQSVDVPNGFEQRLRQRQTQLNNPLNTIPQNKAYAPHGSIPNTPLAASTISFLLGITFSPALISFILGALGLVSTPYYQLGFFVATWTAFHWGEFAVTAGWNLEKCSVDSFLLENGKPYHIAFGVATIEYLVTLYFKPDFKTNPYVSTIGILCVVVGQVLRSTAMIHASTNFSHMVASRKRDEHQLVTDGVYAWFRHPSYAGFYYWALGTQIVLQNPISFVGFAIVLGRFFYTRTRGEEIYLVKFFGDDYVNYRKRVGTKIPFIP